MMTFFPHSSRLKAFKGCVKTALSRSIPANVKRASFAQHFLGIPKQIPIETNEKIQAAFKAGAIHLEI
jgi:hypothetical protein